MENPTAFDLNHAISRWRDDLRQSPYFREENLAELEAHLRDSVAELQGRGLTDEEAFLLATRRIGDPERLDPEFAKVNRGQVWLNRVLWMLVGVQVWGLLCTIAGLVTNAAVLGGLAGLGYKFQHTARPYSDNLFPAAMFSLANLLALVACVAGSWWIVRRKEDAVSKAAAKSLQHPVLLGLAVSLLFVAFTLSSTLLQMPLMSLYYPIEAIGNISMARALASFVLGPLQTLGFVVLTIMLCRRRLGVSERKYRDA